MRFIGSKTGMLDRIEELVKEKAGAGGVFCDIFSGTACVAARFKPRFEIISNDALYFSYVLQKALIEGRGVPEFLGLKKIGINDPLAFLEEAPVGPGAPDGGGLFITKNYSPNGSCQRMYFTEPNARRIDYIRQTVEAWREAGLVGEGEYFYLLAALIEQVPSVSNITGTYGAYLKTWDRRSFKPLRLARLRPADNGRDNRSFNEDGLRLIDSVEGDVLYIDPPYNSRQYAPNYHLLETVARYDSPEIKGVTGMRPCGGLRSPFCVRSKAAEAMEELVSKARFPHIIISYSTEGLIPDGEMEALLRRCGDGASFGRRAFPYRKYSSHKGEGEGSLAELLYYIRKPQYDRRIFTAAPAGKKPARAEGPRCIKSPTNYIGGKFRILPQLLPLFPRDIGVFVDLFAGGCTVGVNSGAKKVIFNDINSVVMELFEFFRSADADRLLASIDGIIEEYALSPTNREGFERLRRDYNGRRDPLMLYVLSCYSFNYQFRFNSRHEYNNPFGRNRSRFSPRMRENLAAFVGRIQQMDAVFSSVDFGEFDFSPLGPGDLVYCDPPYLITTGSYNDGSRGFKDWGENEERQLCALLDRLDRQGVRFALSSVLEHKGRVNEIMTPWAEKYRVADIERDYSNASYHTRTGSSREVVIMNY